MKPISLARIWNMAVFALRLAALPVKRLSTPDAIVVSSPSIFPVIAGHRWARRFAARYVFEVRDLWPLTLVELGGASRLNPLVIAMQWLETYGFRTADRVVSVLPCAREYMVGRGMRSDKFIHIPNGVDVASEIDRCGSARSSDSNSFVVGFAGA